MRIPPSVIVMSLLTAAPFGMAIKETLAKKHPVEEVDEWGLDYERRSARQDKEALAEYEAERARDAEERAEKRIANIAKLDQLFGKTPASMGSLLEGIALGADAGDFQPEATRERIERASEDGMLSVSFEADEKRLHSVSIALDGREYDSTLDTMTDYCEPLREKLVAAWGRPSLGSTWLDETTHQRATLVTDSCALTFGQYLTAEQWIALLPLDSLGKPAEKYLATYAATNRVAFEEYSEEYVYWASTGLGTGNGPTKYTVGVDVRGKISGFRVLADSDFDSFVTVRDALAAKLKSQPKLDDDTGSYVWSKKPGVSLTQSDDNRIELVVGKDPWE
jgi:hypothetical protein